MLKSASTHTILSDASEELIGNEPWTIDIYADGLMDEIFADVEDILEGKRLGSQFKQKSPVKSRPIVNPEIPGQIKPINLHHQQAGTKTVVKSPISDSTVSKGKTSNEKNLSPKSRPRWKKLISVSVSLALATAGLTWLIYSGLVDRIFARIFAEELHLAQIEQSLTEKSLTEKIDPQAELVSYMLGALAAIEQGELQDTSSSSGMMASVTGNFQGSTIQNSAIQSSIPIASTNTAAGSLPPVRAANNLQPIPSRSTKVVERIYIPVYQAPAPMRYKPPSVASASPGGNLSPVREVAHKSYSKAPISNAGKVAKNTVPATTLTLMKTEFKPVEMGNRPVAVGVAPQPKPVVPPKLTDAKVPIENNTSVNTASVQDREVAFAAAKPSHELLGVMELGEKSAALFKIEGITRRIHKGESIGSSGWTLVDVSNNEIVVRRNGEVRSIQTGQKI